MTRKPIKLHELPKDATVPQILDDDSEVKKLKDRIKELEADNKELEKICETAVVMRKEFQRRLSKYE